MSETTRPETRPSPPSDQTPWHRVHLWKIQAVRDAVVVAGMALLVWLGYVLSVVTTPLLLALGLAYLFEPVMARISRLLPRLGRSGAVLSVVAMLLIAVGLVGAFTVPVAVRQAGALMRDSDRHLERLRTAMTSKQLPGWLRDAVAPLVEVLPEDHRQHAAAEAAGPAATPPEAPPGAAPAAQQAQQPQQAVPALDEARIRAIVRDELDRHERKPAPAVGGIAHTGWTLLGYVFGFLGGVGGAGLFLLVMGFCFIYFSVSFPRVQAWFAELVPKAGKSRTLDLLARMDQVVSGFVRGRIIVAGLVGLIYALGWTLVGVPYGFLLGLAVGLCSLVPYLAAIGLPMAWLLLVVELAGAQERGGMYFIGEGSGAAISWWRVLLFPALVNVVAQLLEDYVLNPAIQGKATNLHPATIMIAVIAGGALAGLYGMLLAIPVAACLKILMDESIMPRIRQWLAGRREDPLPESR